MKVTLEAIKAFAVQDIVRRYHEKPEELQIVYMSIDPVAPESESEIVVALKDKAHPNIDTVFVYKYDAKTDRMTHYQWADALLQYADNFSEQLEKAIVKKGGNSNG